MSYRFNYDYYVTFPFYFFETFHSMTFQSHVHFPNCLYVVSMFVILLFSRSQVFNFLISLIHKEMCLVLGRRNICIARKQMIKPFFFLNQMGNNLDAYRAAIGLFHACEMSLNIGYDSRSDTFHDILVTNLRCSFLFASLLIL